MDEKIVQIAERKMNLDAAILTDGGGEASDAAPAAAEETRAMQRILEELIVGGAGG